MKHKLGSVVAGVFGRVLEYDKKMTVKRSVLGIVALATMLSLSGCTLAVKDAGGEEELRNPMIGVFVTTEDLLMMDFDWDAYFEENIENLINGGDVNLQDSVDSEKRIYATIDKHDSKEPSEWEVCFEGLEGYSFFNAHWQMEDGEPFTMMTLSDEICNIGQHFNYTDNGDEMQLSGTIYMTPTMSDTVYYMNPVYQTEAGDIYVVPGGMGDYVGGVSMETTLTLTMSDEVKVTENGVKKTNKTTVKLTYESAYLPTEILVYQMDANNNIVKTESFAPGTLPEEMKAQADVAYVIVETKLNNPENPDECLREVYGPENGGETYFETFVVTEDGGLGRMNTRIVWE